MTEIQKLTYLGSPASLGRIGVEGISPSILIQTGFGFITRSGSRPLPISAIEFLVGGPGMVSELKPRGTFWTQILNSLGGGKLKFCISRGQGHIPGIP